MNTSRPLSFRVFRTLLPAVLLSAALAAAAAPGPESGFDNVFWDDQAANPGLNERTESLAADGAGSVLLGGSFTVANGVTVNRAARWDGFSWSALGSGSSSAVYSMATDTLGNVYFAGEFDGEGLPPYGVVKWDGVSRTMFAPGVYGVRALAVDIAGNLYAGGAFTLAGEVPVNRIARWDGAAWSALGSGMEQTVVALAADDGGTLYAGGGFTAAGGVPAAFVAKWDGAAWSGLGDGVGAVARALAVDKEGNLYAGGDFTTAGGRAANHVAKWDGSSWSPLGPGLNGQVLALAFDGAGALYAGGTFTTAGGVAVNRIAKWDGAAWSAFGAGLNNHVYALEVDRNTLLVGGHFTGAGGKVSNYFAMWQPRVNRSQTPFSGNPGTVVLGDDAFGFHKPSLTTGADTTVFHAAGLPVAMELDRAEEIWVRGARVNGAFSLGPVGVEFGGSGATLRIEFSQDDVAAYGVAYTDFRACKLSYPPDYPANREAAACTLLGSECPVPVRVENGRQIYAVSVPIREAGGAYGAVPVPPAAPADTDVFATSGAVLWMWADNSDNESGFKVWDGPGAGAPATLRTVTAANATMWAHTGLPPNSQHTFQVAATNVIGDSGKTAPLSAWTLAAAPAAPAVGAATADTLNVAVGGGDGNPAHTTYAIRCVTLGNWVQPDGALAPMKAWQTAAAWGTTTVTGLSESTVYAFAVRARNGAGAETASGPVRLGATLPDVTLPVGTLEINGGAAVTAAAEVVLLVTYDDFGGSGVTDMRFSNDGGDWSAWEPAAGAASWILSAGDGPKTVHAQFRDALGNVSAGDVRADILLDTTPPEGAVLLNSGAAYATVRDVAVSITFDDHGGSGVVSMRLANDCAAWGVWEPAAGAKPWALPDGEGVKTVCVQLRDGAGNISPAFSDDIALDTAPPTGTVLINGGLSATNDPAVTLSLEWDDGAAGSGATRMRFSDDGAVWTAWEPLAATRTHTLPSGTDGYRTVRVQYRDRAGLVSGRLNDYILLDTTKPTGTIILNGGAVVTDSTTVTLSLTWSDGAGPGTGVRRMRFSNDGASWSPWEPLAATRTWALSAPVPGHHTVRVQYRDGAANVSDRFSDYIRLDSE